MAKILKFGLLILLLVSALTAYEVVRNAGLERIPARDSSLSLNVKNDAVLRDLENGRPYDVSILRDSQTYVGHRFDTSDFRLQSLARILYEHREALTPEDYETIRDTFIEFKYWMDQPGSDSMCYWSENHQLLFAASEYLAGQYWPDEIFPNTGQTGRDHQALARERILIWLEQRWLYGFTEWYSNTYYVEDIAPLSNLIDFAEDEEIVVKAQIILDLLLYDVATQSYRGNFISSSGRMYGDGKRFPEKNEMRAVIDSIWDPTRWGDEPSERTGMDLNFIYINNYQVPPVIRAIGADDQRDVVIKASTGLDLDELAGEDLIGLEDRQIMMQLAMEAFSNEEVIDTTMAFLQQNQMFSNEFLHDLNSFNLTILTKTGLLPPISRWLNPVTNGTAIQRANTYTFKTPDYMLASAQAYHPGTYGDQQHLWNALLSRDVSVFTTHPAKPLSEKGALSGSPGYWVGSGRLPHVVQDRNVVLNVYRIPDKKGFMEKSIQDYTHAHFPSERFDEVRLDGRYAFGRVGQTYGAFIARNPLHYAEGTTDDLVQPGTDTYWVFEAGSRAADGEFEAFIARIKSNQVSYDNGKLTYHSGERLLELRFQGEFQIDGIVQDLEYPRFDSPYAQAQRKPDNITIRYQGESLLLDFYNGRREVSSATAASFATPLTPRLRQQ
ncbi:MAG: hypothetical protein KDI33_20255 [Halioglobus sp.]|nr:hypothetical protein [Halioglobus sp.]